MSRLRVAGRQLLVFRRSCPAFPVHVIFCAPIFARLPSLIFPQDGMPETDK